MTHHSHGAAEPKAFHRDAGCRPSGALFSLPRRSAAQQSTVQHACPGHTDTLHARTPLPTTVFYFCVRPRRLLAARLSLWDAGAPGRSVGLVLQPWRSTLTVPNLSARLGTEPRMLTWGTHAVAHRGPGTPHLHVSRPPHALSASRTHKRQKLLLCATPLH